MSESFQSIRWTKLRNILDSRRGFGMLALLLVSSTSWLRGRGVPLLWGSENVCRPDGATSILAKGQLWALMREMAEGWRGVKETAMC